MTQENHREISLSRLRRARFLARNPRGGVVEMGAGDDEAFTPVEVLLAAIGGCNAVDVDSITAKRAEPDRFEMHVSAEKVRDEHGNRVVDIRVRLAVEFPDSDGGAAARAVLPNAVRLSHDRLCTVGRTVEVGTPVTIEVEGGAR